MGQKTAFGFYDLNHKTTPLHNPPLRINHLIVKKIIVV